MRKKSEALTRYRDRAGSHFGAHGAESPFLDKETEA